jgi:hypothetical protein
VVEEPDKAQFTVRGRDGLIDTLDKRASCSISGTKLNIPDGAYVHPPPHIQVHPSNVLTLGSVYAWDPVPGRVSVIHGVREACVNATAGKWAHGGIDARRLPATDGSERSSSSGMREVIRVEVNRPIGLHGTLRTLSLLLLFPSLFPFASDPSASCTLQLDDLVVLNSLFFPRSVDFVLFVVKHTHLLAFVRYFCQKLLSLLLCIR